MTTPRPGDSEEERLQRIDRWTPRVKTVIDLDAILNAKGKLVGKAVGGAAAPKERTETTEVDEGDDGKFSDSEEEQMGDAYEWKEPEFLTIGVIGIPYPSLTTIHPFVGQPNVGESSLLNAIFGTTRVRGSRTPDRTISRQRIFRPSSGPPMPALLTARDSLYPRSYRWISRLVYISPSRGRVLSRAPMALSCRGAFSENSTSGNSSVTAVFWRRRVGSSLRARQDVCEFQGNSVNPEKQGDRMRGR